MSDDFSDLLPPRRRPRTATDDDMDPAGQSGEEPIEAVGAERCYCGFKYPWFEVIAPGKPDSMIKVVCKCGREGPASLWCDDAVEAWNKMGEE